MLLRKLIAMASLIAGAAARRLRIRGAEDPAAMYGAYVLEFGQGVDAVETVNKYFSEKNVDIAITLTMENKFTNSVSIRIAGEHVDQLVTDIPAVSDIFAVHYVEPPAPVSDDQRGQQQRFAPESIHSITGVNEVREKLGLTGKGIRVAVIDSGVDYKHPALGGCYGPGCRTSFGWDIAVQDSDPFDSCGTSSHGTHVAGIIGADARNITDPAWAPPFPFTGVAPEVTMGHYRVFSCPSSSTTTDIIASAIYRAEADKADIITESWWWSSVAADRVSEQGVLVFSAQGNDGASGMYTASSPAVSRLGFGIASFDNVESARTFLRFDGKEYMYGVGANGKFNFGSDIEVVVADINADVDNKQNDGAPGSACPLLLGLMLRWGPNGGIGTASRCNWAAGCGAAFCMIYSDTDEIFGIAGSARIPSMISTRTFGQGIIAAVKAGQTPKVQMTDDLNFSASRLLELSIKPDLGGIGGLVYSTWTKFAQTQGALKYPYNSISGTSMACPYVAGVAALILEAYGKDRPTFEQVRTILQNSAVPQKKFGTDMIDSVSYQGAGLINAYKALTTKTVVTPSRIALNDTSNINEFYSLTITNKNTFPVTYIVSHQPAVMVTPFNTGDDIMQVATAQKYTPDYATVRFSTKDERAETLEFTLAPGTSLCFKAYFKPPSNAIAGTFPVYSGYIYFHVKGDDSKTVSVPYAGVVGSWRDAPKWSRTSAAMTTQLGSINPPSSPVSTSPSGTLPTPPSPRESTVPPTPSNLSPNPPPSTSPQPQPSSSHRLHQLRIASVELNYKGQDWASLAAIGISQETNIVIHADSSIPLNPDAATGALVDVGVSRLFFTDGMARNTPVQGGSGWVVTNGTDEAQQAIKLPAGPYEIRFSALKYFERPGKVVGAKEWDSIFSPVFQRCLLNVSAFGMKMS
ncbi:peptidase S8/S53 domain-containing protein [Chytridium lagenaria]|nr:peptidase S8/S53 domain-containing protein [Chytridium lagenaria]